MPLLGADEIGELERVADEEDRGVVSDQIPVAFSGVELDCETADITLRIGSAEFTGNRGEAKEQGRLLAELGEDLRPGISRDVVGDRERPVGAPSLCMDDALRNPLAVLVGQLLDQLVILQQHGAAWSRRLAVLIVGDGCAGGRRQGLHGTLL